MAAIHPSSCELGRRGESPPDATTVSHCTRPASVDVGGGGGGDGGWVADGAADIVVEASKGPLVCDTSNTGSGNRMAALTPVGIKAPELSGAPPVASAIVICSR